MLHNLEEDSKQDSANVRTSEGMILLYDKSACLLPQVGRGAEQFLLIVLC